MFEVENKDGSKNTISSTLCEYGAPIGSGGPSAMAKLVGIPGAVGMQHPQQSFFVKPLTKIPAVQQVLNGTISERGILAPMNGKLNKPIMKELDEKYG